MSPNLTSPLILSQDELLSLSHGLQFYLMCKTIVELLEMCGEDPNVASFAWESQRRLQRDNMKACSTKKYGLPVGKSIFLEFSVDKPLPSCVEKSLKSISSNYLACVST